YKPRSKARIDTLLACLQLFVLSQFLRLSALQAQPIKWCHTHSGSVFLPQITINKVNLIDEIKKYAEEQGEKTVNEILQKSNIVNATVTVTIS
ncbi:MAG: hypothetical protein K2M78_16870, partial [Lachnospiraceae bacterium]|nr:hypothetical protein [Lachnospiraceae bacterium]